MIVGNATYAPNDHMWDILTTLGMLAAVGSLLYGFCSSMSREGKRPIGQTVGRSVRRALVWPFRRMHIMGAVRAVRTPWFLLMVGGLGMGFAGKAIHTPNDPTWASLSILGALVFVGSLLYGMYNVNRDVVAIK